VKGSLAGTLIISTTPGRWTHDACYWSKPWRRQATIKQLFHLVVSCKLTRTVNPRSICECVTSAKSTIPASRFCSEPKLQRHSIASGPSIRSPQPSTIYDALHSHLQVLFTGVPRCDIHTTKCSCNPVRKSTSLQGAIQRQRTYINVYTCSHICAIHHPTRHHCFSSYIHPHST
jgi:hypothetical protein